MASAESVAGAPAASSAAPQQRLLKGQLSLPNCVALSAAVMAPVLAVILNAPAAGPQAGAALPLSFLVAFVACFFVANTVIQFTKRLPSSGSFYTFCSHGLGGGAGFFTGWLYGGAFVALAVGLFTANGAFLHQYLLSEWHVHVAWWLLALIEIGLVFAFSLRSIKASVRIDLALLAFEMIVFLVLGIIAIARAGGGNSAHYFSPSASPHHYGGVAIGVVFGILSFIGFESAAVLGEETRDARRNIPRAVFGAMLIIGVFYVFMMYALAAGYHLNDAAGMKAFLGDSTPFPTLANRYASWMTQIVDIAAVLGLFSCFLAVQNATVRVLFAMGRERVLPPALGRVHSKFHSPYIAIYTLTMSSIAIGLGLSAWLGNGVTDVYGWTGSIGTVAIVIVYMMANLALIRFFARDPERNIFLHVVLPILGIAALAYPLYFVAKPGQAYPYNLVPYVVLVWIVLGFATYFYFRANSPEKLAAVGSVLAEEEDSDFAEGKLASAPV
jgi:amino acid transporter